MPFALFLKSSKDNFGSSYCNDVDISMLEALITCFYPRNDHVFSIMPSSCGRSQAPQVRQALQELQQRLQGKKDVFLYFYFSGHSDQNGNLLCWCSSEDDVVTEAELKEDLEHLNVNELFIILDCCYADGKIASEHIKDDNFLVHKSPAPLESKQHPLESLYNNLQKTVHTSHEGSVKPVSDVSEELPQVGFDTLDGNVFTKAPLGRFTIRQWSSSLSHEESYAKAKGSFFTQFIICGLRGTHECQFANCSSCDTFKAKAKSLGYISAANLEDFVSNHVENAALRAGGRRQTPRMRTVHSKETILAFYNEEILRDEIVFRSTSGISQRINIDGFPLPLLEFQMLVYSNVQGNHNYCILKGEKAASCLGIALCFLAPFTSVPDPFSVSCSSATYKHVKLEMIKWNDVLGFTMIPLSSLEQLK